MLVCTYIHLNGSVLFFDLVVCNMSLWPKYLIFVFFSFSCTVHSVRNVCCYILLRYNWILSVHCITLTSRFQCFGCMELEHKVDADWIKRYVTIEVLGTRQRKDNSMEWTTLVNWKWSLKWHVIMTFWCWHFKAVKNDKLAKYDYGAVQ